MTNRQLSGFCPLCETSVTFVMEPGDPYRSLRCEGCRSFPRNRALWFALNNFFPGWSRLVIHEASPGWDRVSARLAAECTSYHASQYDDRFAFGTEGIATELPCRKYSSQNLESQTYPDESFDLVITQDVFEHVFDPFLAIQEIARTLKPGGATLMTVPVVRRFEGSRRRAALVDGKVEHIIAPEYHGNPISTGDGSLVTIDWGCDIAAQLSSASGLWFVMQTFEDLALGIKDECNQVLVGFKSHLPMIG